MKSKFPSKRIILVTAVLGLLVFLHWLNWLNPVERALAWAFNPVRTAVHRAGVAVNGLFSEHQDIQSYEALVEQLQEDNKNLLEANARLRLLEEENQALREHLLFQHKSGREFIMANIIARGDIGTAQQRMESLTIDKGSDDGLYEGLAVLSGQGTIIGKIDQVSPQNAEVLLTNHRDCRLAAKLTDSEKTSGIVQGDLGLTLKMEFIPQSTELESGTLVVSSGLESSIPAGLVIGRVSEIFKENNELWQEAIIEPLVDPADLLVVSVLMP